MNGKARFCEDCPLVPKGATVEVTDLEYMDRRKLPDTDVRFINSHHGDATTLVARIGTIVIDAPERSGVEPGEPGELFVLAGALTREEVKEKIKDCHSPKKSLLKGTICQAIEQSEIVPV